MSEREQAKQIIDTLLRVGDYRIIYTVDNGQLIVRVVDAGNRGQIYNRY